MRAHNIRIETFCEEKEFKAVQKWLENILPDDTLVEDNIVGPELEGGVFREPLVLLSAKIEKTKDVSEFLKKLRENLGEKDIENLRNEVQNRVDDNCNFYIRLGKKELGKGKLVLKSSDSIHVKIKVAVYPAKKEIAVNAVEGWLR